MHFLFFTDMPTFYLSPTFLHFWHLFHVCVKYQQTSLVAGAHFSLLAVTSVFIVNLWQRRCCLWTDDLIDFVLYWAKWQWWTDGWEKRLWFQPSMSHAKLETASILAQPIVSPAEVSYTPSAITERDCANYNLHFSNMIHVRYMIQADRTVPFNCMLMLVWIVGVAFMMLVDLKFRINLLHLGSSDWVTSA